MAITLDQIQTALDAIGAMGRTLNDLRLLLAQAKELADKNWQVDIGSRVSLLVTVSAEQRAAMLAQYDTYKSQLITAFQQLP